MRHTLTQEQIAKIKKRRRKWEERRRRLYEAWLRWQEGICRQIEEARRRRKTILFWLLVGLIMTQALSSLFMPRPIIYRPEPAPKPPRRQPNQDKIPVKEPREWQPSPENDFAPLPGHGDFIDGYSREAWEKYADERGWRPGSKQALKKAWESDPERELFPPRYRYDYDHRPSLFELMTELREPFWKSDAFAALKLIAPAESRQWLDEAYSLDPSQIRRAFAKSSPEIAENMKLAAVLWEEGKRKEAEEALKEAKRPTKGKGKDAENDDDEDDDQGIPPIK